MTDEGAPAAGWYADPDPNGGGHLHRWWDGTAWTQHTKEPTPPPPAPPTTPPVQPGFTPGYQQPAYAQTYQQAAYQQPAYAQTYQQPAYPPGYTVPAGAPSYVTGPAPTRRPFGGGQYNPAWDYARGKNSASNTALTGGLGAILTCWAISLGYLSWVAIILTAGAFVWGIIGLRRSPWLGVGKKRSIWAITLGSIAAAVLIAGTVGLLTGATSGLRYDKTLVQQSIVDGVKKQSGQVVTASCPVNPPFTVGSTFQCIVTDSTGTNHLIDVKVQDNTGYITWQAHG